MDEQNHYQSAKKLIESSSSIVVCLPADPSLDLVSAGISLFLSLKNSGKNCQIGCGKPLQVDPALKGVTEITDSIGSRNLVISFDYHEDDLEKVDYDVRPDGKFYLLVKPKPDSPVPDITNVKYSYSGATADLVITLGISSLEELGKLYADEKDFFDSAGTLSLNIIPRPIQFTQNQIHETHGSFSELVTLMIDRVGLKPTLEASSNLLRTIYDETKSLTSPRISSDTFLALSVLMRNGARLPNQQVSVPRFTQPAFFEGQPAAGHDQNVFSATDTDTQPADQPVPQDWTKPKIFKVGNLE